MTKYRAKVDLPPTIKQGDIVEFKDKLAEGYKQHFVEVGEGEALTFDEDGNRILTDEAGDRLGDLDGGSEKEFVANPDRASLKEKAEELGLDFAPNITTAKLQELVTEAEKNKA